MKVGFLQFEPQFGEIKHNLEFVRDALASVTCDLMVLPELAMTGYQFTSQDEVWGLSESVPHGQTTQALIELAQQRSIYVVAGLVEREKDECFNSAILVGPHGYLGVYRKTHLFFEEILFFTSGNTGFRVWDIGLAKIGILVCFDWYYPEAARTLVLQGAEILCHPSNLVLTNCPDAMVTRCLENRVFSITANRIGVEARGGKHPLTYIGQSEIVAPQGTILHRASPTQEELYVVDIDVKEARNKSLNPYNDVLRDRQQQYYDQ